MGMNMGILALVLLPYIAGAIPLLMGSQCLPTAPRTDCGYSGINQQGCIGKGCCWGPVNPNPSNLPWCYKAAGPSPAPPTPPTPPDQCPLPGCDTFSDNRCVGNVI